MQLFHSILNAIFSEFADAFDAIEYNNHTIQWNNGFYDSIHLSINESEIEKQVTNLIPIEKGDESCWVLWRHKKDKIKSPFIDEYQFGYYSFEERESIYKIRAIIAKILDKTDLNLTEQYIGGLLHLFKGIIHTIEDLQGNIIQLAISYTIDVNDNQMNIISNFTNMVEVYNSDFGELLFERILSFEKNEMYYIQTSSNHQMTEILELLHFEKYLFLSPNN